MHDLHDNLPVCPADLVASLPEDCRQCYIKNWSQIRSRHVVDNLCRYTLSDWRRIVTLMTCFRPSSRHQGFGLKTLGSKTKELASRFFATLEHPESFTGVHLRDSHTLHKFFSIHTFVYSLVHRPTDIPSKQQSQEAFRFNLYDDHFSYVNHLSKYSRCYTCQRCDASFPKAWCLIRHERSRSPSQESGPRRSVSSLQNHF